MPLGSDQVLPKSGLTSSTPLRRLATAAGGPTKASVGKTKAALTPRGTLVSVIELPKTDGAPQSGLCKVYVTREDMEYVHSMLA